MNYVSLFSGVGGFDLGFDRAGMKCALQVERDAAARAVLRAHWPTVMHMEDVRDVTTEHVRGAGLICGGFPCQDVSVAGKRAGLAGERSGLWFQFHRILAAAQPRWAVIENVSGLLSSNGGRDMGTILRGLADIGYRCAWRVLDSQYFGVPQRRRVFLVGHLGDTGAIDVLFERDSGAWDTAPQRTAGRAAPTLFGSGAGTGRTASTGSESQFCITAADFAHTLAARTHKGGDPTSDTYLAVSHVVSPTLRANVGGLRPEIGGDAIVFDWQQGGHSIVDQSNTLTSTRTQADGLSTGVRRLTPTECERLQGFPDGWTEGHSDSARYRMMGNAVTVNVAEWLGRRIMAWEAGQ